MKFASMYFNYLFILFSALIGLFVLTKRRKRVLLDKFADKKTLATLMDSHSRQKANIKTVLILAAVLFIIITLLRPQWGFRWEEVEHRGVDFFVAVDVSKSMLTQDVLPNRLERAKLALEDLVQQLQGDRIGLIAFAGDAFVQCPLTIDYSGFLLAVRDLNTELIPKPGTNIANAIQEALKSFPSGSEGANRALIIITDGEDHVGDALSIAEKAAKEQVKIYTIGVGTTQGELIVTHDEQGNSTYLKDRQGQVVKSRLNETLLANIALKGQGTYIKSTSTEFGLELLYNSKINAIEKKTMQSSMRKKMIERFQIPLGLAILLLFIEPFITNRKKQ